MTRTWKDVWAARTLDTGQQLGLEQLMAADGLDTGFGRVTETAWRGFVNRAADRLAIAAGTRVFEVGCGAGAFLLPIHERGAVVGGLDQSAALISYAAAAMPGGAFALGDAADLDAAGWEVVVACSVFMYFPDLDYAARVLQRMAAARVRAVAVLDVPDRDREREALAFRRGAMRDAEYAEKYRGLDHLFYERAWMRATLEALGATVAVEDQQIDGYQNARFRFNAIARW
jgi:trans-aconitate methyltransferase